ncbi:hypothetical protein FOH10_26690 [Nocardia otitidiscaviarum]|uniref:Uncharacterized protein n=1 Tax=Nocardia otitidiscaviarum TaxID=1823 RepID=A0A516NSA1_9NOCA|nr:hypothetical protein [Nocardia otitidiscaviarum]MCP9621019.1 hypothetical protein [Nocardia otitidiscaviarum]QDP81783.1 hypothetical protein FOH10_26690 [Nocardia otitidiscaviarum]
MTRSQQAARERIRSAFEEVLAQGLRRDSVRGATAAEIARYADRQQVAHVPAAVHEVFQLIGGEPGLWFDGTDFGVESGIDDTVKRGVVGQLLDRTEQQMRDPAGMLVLSAHQGYLFHGIDGPDLALDDPPVWEIGEGRAVRRWDSTTAWFTEMEPLVESRRRELERYDREGRPRPSWARFILPRTAGTPPVLDPGPRIGEIVERVFAAGLRRDSVVGASDAAIDRFAAAQGVERVPTAVRATLRLLGEHPGFWLHPMTFGVHGIDGPLKRQVLEVVGGMDHGLRDAAGMLVLAAYPGQAYHVVDGVDLVDEDPPVWEIGEGERTRRVRAMWGSTTGWLDAMTPDVPRARRTVRRAVEQGRPLPEWARFLEEATDR